MDASRNELKSDPGNLKNDVKDLKDIKDAKKDMPLRQTAEPQLEIPAGMAPVSPAPAGPSSPAPPMEQRDVHRNSSPDSASKPENTPVAAAIQTEPAVQIRLRSRNQAGSATPPIPDFTPVVQGKTQQQESASKPKSPATPAVPPHQDNQDGAYDQTQPEKAKPFPGSVTSGGSHVVIANRVEAAAAAVTNAAPASTASGERVSATTASAPSLPTRSAPAIPAAVPNAHLQEPVTDQKGPQPAIRSVALEFTPDGASDVRLRLSERAGEVHISLHSQDSALSGRLHAGVNELVCSLSRAGYEAESWTSSQGQQHQRQPQDEEKPRGNRPSEGAVEDFNNLFQQPAQETS